VFLTIQVLVFADVLLRMWIGPSAANDMLVIRIVLIAVPFYLFYSSLRSVIDAGSIRPRNAINTLTALAAQALMISLAVGVAPRAFLVPAIGLSLVIAFALLAFLTATSLSSLYSVHLNWKEAAVPIGIALAFGAIALMCRRWLGIHVSMVVMLELVLGSAFLLTCLRLGAPWAQLVLRLLFPQGTEFQNSQRVT
jgi:hypothetical protein